MSKSNRARMLLMASLLIASTFPARGAETIFIDFESFPGPDGVFGTADDVPAPPCPDGICFPLSNEYASLGLSFTSGTLGQFPLFPGLPEDNHIITSSPPDVTLDRDAYSVSIESNSAWTAVLWAFDAGGGLIATASLAPTGQPGTLSRTTSRPIRRFTVRAEGCPPAGRCERILNLDNLTIQGPPEPPEGEWLVTPEIPGFRFKVRIRNPAGVLAPTRQESECLAETLCVSGALRGRMELLARVVGPKPNGYLWPTLARLTTSQVEVWIEQISSGELKYYLLRALSVDDAEIPGVVDRFGFRP